MNSHWRKWWRRLLALGVTGFVLLNVVAYFHAYRLTHFSGTGPRTAAANRLSMLEQAIVLVTGVSMPKPVNTISPQSKGLPFEVVNLTTRDNVGLEAWRIAGNGPVVLMFHGHAVPKQVMLTEAAFFHKLGHEVLLVDLRGCGGSAGNVTTLGWREADDVLAAYRWAEQQHPGRRILLYGQSLGAAAVLRAVTVHQLRPAGILVEEPFDRLVTTVGHRFHAMHLPAAPMHWLLVFWGSVQHRINGFAMNPADYARAVRSPLLILGGEHDPWVRPAELRRIADAAGERAQLHVFADGNHGAFIHTHAEEYRQLVTAWFAKLR